MSRLELHADRIRSYRDETQKTRYLLSDVIAHTSNVFRVSIADILGPRRHKELVRPRQCISLIARNMCTHMSYPQMAEVLNRDHSTVIYNAQQAVKLYDDDEGFRANVDLVIARLKTATRPPAPAIKTGRTKKVFTPKKQAASDEDRDEEVGEYYRANIREGSAALLTALQKATLRNCADR